MEKNKKTFPVMCHRDYNRSREDLGHLNSALTANDSGYS